MICFNNKLQIKKKAGFTLLELVVVVSIVSILITATTGVIASVVRARQKASLMLNVNTNGNNAIQLLTEVARTGKDFELVDADNNLTNGYEVLEYSSQDGVRYEIGIIRAVGDSSGCDLGTTSNGYLYVVTKGGNPASEASKATNDDLSRGVNVTPGWGGAQQFLSVSSIPGVDLIDIYFTADRSLCDKLGRPGENFSQRFNVTIKQRSFAN